MICTRFGGHVDVLCVRGGGKERGAASMHIGCAKWRVINDLL